MRPGHEYAAHARRMAKQWGVRMVEDSGLQKDEAHAQPSNRSVVHAPIDDETSYIVSMHEIGHLVMPNGFLRDTIKPKTALEKVKLQLVEEEAAWDWAQANVLDGEWTAGMEQTKTFAFATYVECKRALESGTGVDFEFEFGKIFDGVFSPADRKMFEGMLFGGPVTPPVPHDEKAVHRRAETYRAMAKSIADAIKKRGGL